MPTTPEINEARRVSFDARAELYDAVRPSYPEALADDVLAGAGRRVLEIGPGTGKATLMFARRGAAIVAIEPGASLAAVLRRNAAGLDVTVLETTFEDWVIDRRFDVVMAAQAIHWIDPQVRYVKAAAALEPGGTLAVIRNENAVGDRELRTELNAVYAQWRAGEGERSLDEAVEATRHALVSEIAASGLFDPASVKLYPWRRTFTTARYLDLLDTYSDHATLAPERRAGLYRAIAAAIDRRGGTLEVPHVAMAIVARRSPVRG